MGCTAGGDEQMIDPIYICPECHQPYNDCICDEQEYSYICDLCGEWEEDCRCCREDYEEDW